MVQENVTKVSLTLSEQVIVVTIARYYSEDVADLVDVLPELAGRHALKDAILKLEEVVPSEPARLTKGELEALVETMNDFSFSPKRKGAHLRIFQKFVQDAVGKFQMALYPEDGVPQ